MHNNQLTNLRIGFTLDGYENDILSWLNIVTSFFDDAGYPLKSVSYDINYDRIERKTLKTFYKTIKENPIYPIDKLYSFSVFTAEKQNIPLTYHYGCTYDMPSKQLILFFDYSYGEANVLSFYKEFLSVLLKDRIVHGGYLFYQERHDDYPLGGVKLKQNLYKESVQAWWVLMKPKNREDVLKKKNMYRHIYRQNILSTYHMAEQFDGLVLAEWINKNNYGNIEKIGMENWLWTVPEKYLHELQVIFYNKHLLLGIE